MTKKQAPKSADARWLRRCDAVFQCARLHESFKLLLVLYNSGSNVPGTSASTGLILQTSRAVHECPRIGLRASWRTSC